MPGHRSAAASGANHSNGAPAAARASATARTLVSLPWSMPPVISSIGACSSSIASCHNGSASWQRRTHVTSS